MCVKVSISALAACAAAALTAGAANANVTFYPYGVGAPVLPVIANFSADTVGQGPTHALAGWSWSGSALVQNTTTATGAEPAVDQNNKPVQPKGVKYLDVSKAKFEILVPPGDHITNVELYIGSLDAFNQVTFDLKGAPALTYTGANLATLTGAKANGNQLSPYSNGVFDFTFTHPVTEMEFQSPTGNSFEIAYIAANFFGGVPEPSEWLMLTLGVAMVGALARRGRSLAVA